MRWVTARGVRPNRAATAWLVRRFVDPDATFAVADAADVAREAEACGGIGFDAPGARYPPADAKGRCTFQQIALESCFSDLVLREMGRIVASAESADRVHETHEGAGVRAVCQGFAAAAGSDAEALERSAFTFDALYASLAARLRAQPE